MWTDSPEEHLKDIHNQIEEIEKLGGLRIWMLHVLEHGPKNGVEIMDAVAEHHERFHHMNEVMPHRGSTVNMLKSTKHSSYRPLPGSVYPMLKKMVSEDLIVKRQDGRYEITDKGLEIVYNIFGDLTNVNPSIAVEKALNEMYKLVFYLEDVNEEKLVPHKGVIGDLIERLKKIEDSL